VYLEAILLRIRLGLLFADPDIASEREVAVRSLPSVAYTNRELA